MNAKQLYTQAYSDRRAIKSGKISISEFLKKYNSDERTAKISENAVRSFVSSKHKVIVISADAQRRRNTAVRRMSKAGTAIARKIIFNTVLREFAS